jgi:hypothetical protein
VEFKQCSSCRRVFDAAAWRRLPLCGYQDDGRGGVLELRTCDAVGCGSTLAIVAGAPRGCAGGVARRATRAAVGRRWERRSA